MKKTCYNLAHQTILDAFKILNINVPQKKKKQRKETNEDKDYTCACSIIPWQFLSVLQLSLQLWSTHKLWLFVAKGNLLNARNHVCLQFVAWNAWYTHLRTFSCTPTRLNRCLMVHSAGFCHAPTRFATMRSSLEIEARKRLPEPNIQFLPKQSEEPCEETYVGSRSHSQFVGESACTELECGTPN